MSYAVRTGANKQRSYDGDYQTEGKKAEQIVLDWLRSMPMVVNVEDLSDVRAFQHPDIDCAVTFGDGRMVLGEIKSDRHLGVTGNVLFEVLRINHSGPADRSVVLGWSARSPATYLFIYASAVGRIYLTRMNQLRAAQQRYCAEERRAVRLDWVHTDAVKSTLNILIPWSYCEGIFKTFEVTP